MRTQHTGTQVADKSLAGGDITDNVVLGGTGAVTLPRGTSAQRPTASPGLVRGNSDTGSIEAVINGVWTALAFGDDGAAVQATRSSSLTLTTTSTDILLDTVVTQNDANTLVRDTVNTAKFIAKKAGTYLFAYNGVVNDPSAGTITTVRMKLNGSAISGGTSAPGAPRNNAPYPISGCVVLSLAANDYVTTDINRASAGGTATLNSFTAIGVKLDAIQGPPGMIGGSSTYRYYAAAFDNPNNTNWASNALAPLISDATNPALNVRAFDDTAEEGVGFMLTVPPNASTLGIGLKYRAATSPAGVQKGIQFRLYARSIGDGAAISAWTPTALNVVNTADALYHYSTQQFSLSSMGITAGQLYQFQLTRLGSSANDTLSGDAYLLELEISSS